MDDIELNKRATIARCISRIEQEYGNDPDVLERDITKQDSIVLNNDDQRLTLAIVRAIVERHLDDLLAFAELELEG